MPKQKCENCGTVWDLAKADFKKNKPIKKCSKCPKAKMGKVSKITETKEANDRTFKASGFVEGKK